MTDWTKARFAPVLFRSGYKTAATADNAPINADIPHKIICFVDENNKLSPPTPIEEVLATFDTSNSSLILVDGTKQPPVCRIVPKSDLIKKAKAANAHKKANAKQDKTVTLRWKVAPNDLSRKLDSAKKFLAKGHRVSISFEGPYEGSKSAKEAAIQQVANQLLDMAAKEDLKIKEWHKPKMTFKETTIYYQPVKN